MENKNFKRTTTLLILIPLFLFVGLFFWYFIKAQPSSWSFLVENSSKNVKDLSAIIFDSDKSIDQRANALQSLSQLEDVAVVNILMSVYYGDAGIELKKPAQNGIVNRFQAAGYKVLSRYVENIMNNDQLLTENNKGDLRSSFVVRASDYLSPFEKRKTDLLELQSVDKEMAKQVAAMLSYEGNVNDRDLFKVLLVKILGLEENFNTKPLISIFLSDEALSQLFYNQFIGNLSGVSTSDLVVLVEQLTGENSALIQTFAQELKKRNYFNKLDLVFIDELLKLEINSKTQNIAESLKNGALRKTKNEDVTTLANWQNLGAIRPLLSICMNGDDKNVTVGAFDALSARSSYSEVLLNLFRVIKSGSWKDREKFIRPIGILGLLDIASDQDLNEALNAFMPLASPELMLNLALRSTDARLISGVLEKTSFVASSDVLLNLLRNPDIKVRSLAVMKLAQHNDLLLKYKIQQQYRNEQDPSVRAAFEAHHPWLVNKE